MNKRRLGILGGAGLAIVGAGEIGKTGAELVTGSAEAKAKAEKSAEVEKYVKEKQAEIMLGDKIVSGFTNALSAVEKQRDDNEWRRFRAAQNSRINEKYGDRLQQDSEEMEKLNRRSFKLMKSLEKVHEREAHLFIDKDKLPYGPLERHDAAVERLADAQEPHVVHDVIASFSDWSQSDHKDEIMKLLRNINYYNPLLFKQTGKVDEIFLKEAFAIGAENARHIEFLKQGEKKKTVKNGKTGTLIHVDRPGLEKAAMLQEVLYSYAYPAEPSPAPTPTLDTHHKHHHSRHKDKK